MLVVGNGESRKGIVLDHIDVPKVGCNAIFREAKVLHIVCCDQRMAQEAVKNFVNLKSGIWTRLDWLEHFRGKHNVNCVPGLWYATDEKRDQPFHWGSGSYAVLIACMQSAPNDTVDLLGFDLYGIDKKVNNMYKGSRNYADADSKEIDPSFWIHQIGKCMEHYSHKKFRVFNKEGWEMPNKWKLDNVEFHNITELTNVL